MLPCQRRDVICDHGTTSPPANPIIPANLAPPRAGQPATSLHLTSSYALLRCRDVRRVPSLQVSYLALKPTNVMLANGVKDRPTIKLVHFNNACQVNNQKSQASQRR